MSDLQHFFQSLVQNGRKVHHLETTPQAKYVKFSGNLVVYFDKMRGYDIIRLSQIQDKIPRIATIYD